MVRCDSLTFSLSVGLVSDPGSGLLNSFDTTTRNSDWSWLLYEYWDPMLTSYVEHHRHEMKRGGSVVCVCVSLEGSNVGLLSYMW